jgi:ADP-L-glycero-D-manno-heptose 6-epimerase
MIIVSGGAGFIGSCVVAALNERGRDDIVVVDSLGTTDKWKNLRNLSFAEYLDKSQLFEYLGLPDGIEAIIHMGACSATTERDANYLMENNYRYTERLAEIAINHDIRFVYASSAATYGLEEKACKDDEAQIHTLQPMNMYGYSKQLFDLKARREGWFDRIAGLKFFNVYGPNEYHKADMSSVVFKAYKQIKESGTVRLFKSHRPDFEDGLQQRDFVYVKDAVAMVLFFLDNPKLGGIFNVGSGSVRSFRDLVEATFAAMDLEPNIVYIDMPEDIRDRYQYNTEADLSKVRNAGFNNSLLSLEDGIKDYVQSYLSQDYKHW